jgi:hypothetical protein
MGIDANASMGLRSINRDLVLGPFGVNHINDAERESHDLLSAKGMCSAATYYSIGKELQTKAKINELKIYQMTPIK